jgi:hypothetical protein
MHFRGPQALRDSYESLLARTHLPRNGAADDLLFLPVVSSLDVPKNRGDSSSAFITKIIH